MTTKSFAEFYSLPETEVYAIRNTEEGLAFFLNVDFQMLFEGGNHVRTEFDMTLSHEFVFRGIKIANDFEGPILVNEQSCKDGKLTLVVNGEPLMLPDTEVIVHPNVKPFIDHTIG